MHYKKHDVLHTAPTLLSRLKLIESGSNYEIIGNLPKIMGLNPPG